MAASCREFETLVKHGRQAKGVFTREARLLVIGSEGGEMQAYDEEGAKWHVCGIDEPEYVRALPSFTENPAFDGREWAAAAVVRCPDGDVICVTGGLRHGSFQAQDDLDAGFAGVEAC